MNKSIEIVKLQSVLDRALAARDCIKVLEAGCGSNSHVELGPNTYVVGIDISEKQLQRNPLLHEKILGDLQAYKLPASYFDIILCWDVMEHLPHPEKALANFARSIREDGIIVLAMPNLFSVKGLITKLAPYKLHVLAWRYLYGNKDAGKEDNGPFPTFLRYSISPSVMKQRARRHGLAVEYMSLYESPMHRQLREKYRLTGTPWRLVRRAVKALTLGKVDPGQTDYIIVLKRVASAPRAA